MKSKALYLVLVLVGVFLFSACSDQENDLPELRASTADQVEAGRSLVASYGCGSCHSIPGIPGADALVAPPLEHFYERSYIAGVLPNTRENLIRWVQNPQQIKPG